MIYRRKMELDMEELKPDLMVLSTASKELLQTQRIKQLLSVRSEAGHPLDQPIYIL